MRSRLIFAFVLILFLVSRIYKITEIPASVYWDEASIGYNAYSIATDLKDEWGEKLPLHFRAFGEFKLPVYIYSVALFVKAIGLNEYAVRLPAVIYSLGTLIVLYLLTKKITGKKWVSILASFILTLSPWFFIFSRTGYEATAGLFFYLLAVYIFVSHGLRKNILFMLSIGLFILSMYCYTSFRIISPLTIFTFLIIELKDNYKKNIPIVLLSVLVCIVSIIPVVRLFIYDAGFGRAQTFALIPSIQQVYDLAGKPRLQITFDRTAGINWWQNVATIGKNYLSHFNFNFLVTNGDANPRSQIPGHGQLYWFEIPLILAGLVAMLKSKKAIYYLPLMTLLIAPIPSALTKESPHALRSLLAAPSFAIIVALGVMFLRENFKKISGVILFIVLVAYYLSFELYMTDFITKYSKETASDWQYQYKEIFSNQQSGVVSDNFGQPYIFALYYLKYPPDKFRSEVKLNSVSDWGFSTVKSFNGFQFIK